MGIRDIGKGKIRKEVLAAQKAQGVSIRKIALEHLQYGDPSSLHYYIQTRNLTDEAQRLIK